MAGHSERICERTNTHTTGTSTFEWAAWRWRHGRGALPRRPDAATRHRCFPRRILPTAGPLGRVSALATNCGRSHASPRTSCVPSISLSVTLSLNFEMQPPNEGSTFAPVNVDASATEWIFRYSVTGSSFVDSAQPISSSASLGRRVSRGFASALPIPTARSRTPTPTATATPTPRPRPQRPRALSGGLLGGTVPIAASPRRTTLSLVSSGAIGMTYRRLKRATCSPAQIAIHDPNAADMPTAPSGRVPHSRHDPGERGQSNNLAGFTTKPLPRANSHRIRGASRLSMPLALRARGRCTPNAPTDSSPAATLAEGSGCSSDAALGYHSRE